MTVQLGPTPDTLTVTIVRGGTWWAALQNIDDNEAPLDFPDGDTIELIVGGQTWTATIDGPDATWSQTAEEVETVATSASSRAELWLISDSQRIPWAIGTVQVDG